jgi:hypothetical protein
MDEPSDLRPEGLEELPESRFSLPTASAPRTAVCYADGATPVAVGDEVTASSWQHKRTGRVEYVPGLSPREKEMECYGLSWVGIKLDSGGWLDMVVDPETSRLGKAVTLVSRGADSDRQQPASSLGG